MFKSLNFFGILCVMAGNGCPSSALSTTQNGSGGGTAISMLTAANGGADGKIHDDDIGPMSPPKRRIPDKVMIGYATDCNDKVKVAIEQGVNVVIWAFLNLVKKDDEERSNDKNLAVGNDEFMYKLEGHLDVECIQKFIHEMDEAGYDDTVHLVSFGGWNGPHIEPHGRSNGSTGCLLDSADGCYKEWKRLVGDVFHGIDWDPEGNTDLTSRWNFFTMDTLDTMGHFSYLAKKDGYVVTMAPAQSYLDIQSSGQFSRYVNLTDPARKDVWHEEFHYFGSNVYAYLLAKYGDYIDLISIQFYESYSRAGLEIYHHQMAPEAYLNNYVQDLMNKQQQYKVLFEQDEHVQLKNQNVPVPLSKLVWGFANGWAYNNENNVDRHVYFLPECIQAAYQGLVDWQMEPRGFMFWVIGEEGKNDIYYAKELNTILHIRKNSAEDREGKATTR